MPSSMAVDAAPQMLMLPRQVGYSLAQAVLGGFAIGPAPNLVGPVHFQRLLNAGQPGRYAAAKKHGGQDGPAQATGQAHDETGHAHPFTRCHL